MTRHFAVLDGLRALAVIQVVAYHCRIWPFSSGWLGAELFFALSGFLMCHVLTEEWLKRGSIDVWGFLKRRLLRIYPALFVLLVAFVGFALWRSWSWNRVLPEVLPGFFSYSNWTRASRTGYPRFLGHLWSLSVEVQFYVLCAAFVFFINRYHLRVPRVLGIAGCCIGIIASHWWRDILLSAGAHTDRIYNGLDTRLDSFFIGVLAYLCLPIFRTRAERGVVGNWFVFFLASFGLAGQMFCSVKFTAPRPDTLQLALALNGVACFLILSCFSWASHGIWFRIFSFGPLRWLGTISFGLYLWHYPLTRLSSFPRAAIWDRFLFVSTWSVICAALSFYLLERPLLRWARTRDAGPPSDKQPQRMNSEDTAQEPRVANL